MADLVKQGAFCHAVVIRKSKVYGGCAIVDAVVKTQNGYDSIEPHDHIQIVVEFGTDKARRKSWVRSTFKLGDLFEIFSQRFVKEFSPGKPPRLSIASVEHAKILQRAYWGIERIQYMQTKHLASFSHDREEKRRPKAAGTEGRHHKKITRQEKLLQGEVVASFLVSLMSAAGVDDSVLQLSGGSGVVDVAGGNGWLALAFAKKGIPATVVDPRPSVGCLPKRERRALRRALGGRNKNKRTESIVHAPPKPTMFGKRQAYFGVKPDLCSETEVPLCNPEVSPLFQNCSAVVALHPDQATGSVVEFAVQHKKPFVVVPCCVFSDLFPGRLNKDGTTVSTREEFILYLKNLHTSIKTIELGFKGANVAVYSAW